MWNKISAMQQRRIQDNCNNVQVTEIANNKYNIFWYMDLHSETTNNNYILS